MKLLLNNRSEALTIIMVTLIIVVFIGWLINLKSKECRSNSDCGPERYCGSDFACHQIPIIEKTIVKNNLIIPSIILGIAIIAAALIIKREKISFRKNPHIETSNTQKSHFKMP